MPAASLHRGRRPVRHRPAPRRSSHSPGQQGATLILAIVFLGAILGITLVLFNYGSTASTSLQSYRYERTVRIGADAALQVAVQDVRTNVFLGTSATTAALEQQWYPAAAQYPCSLIYPLNPPEANVPLDAGGPTPNSAVAAGSELVVTCAASDGVTNSGTPVDASGAVQNPRDVTFTVHCYSDQVVTSSGVSDCKAPGPGLQDYQVASARVQYILDFTTNPGAPTAPQPPASATVPKVVSWILKPTGR